jgi:hypothetical protein
MNEFSALQEIFSRISKMRKKAKGQIGCVKYLFTKNIKSKKKKNKIK